MAKARRWRRNLRWKIGGVAFWATIVALFGLWQTVQYRGVMALLAEWQFNMLGRYYPSLTFLTFVAVLLAPALLIFARARRRQSPHRLLAAALRSAKRFEITLLAVAGALFLVALATFIIMLTLPNGQAEPQLIDLSKPLITLPGNGATTITGRVLYGRTSAFSDDLLLARRSVRFAPIVIPQSSSPDLQFFVELPPQIEPSDDSLPASFTGILQKNALPGELVRLYHYAGYRVERPYYVIFASKATLQWPYIATSIQLFLLGLVFLAVWLWQRRRVRDIYLMMDEAARSEETVI